MKLCISKNSGVSNHTTFWPGSQRRLLSYWKTGAESGFSIDLVPFLVNTWISLYLLKFTKYSLNCTNTELLILKVEIVIYKTTTLTSNMFKVHLPGKYHLNFTNSISYLMFSSQIWSETDVVSPLFLCG